ncbi:hypothetical protein SARC_03756 [Sphaeroforma arctica JP610]|uniref:F-box domain-containing protein n=1 Tax=Sphaeroforma arctica JP610 TaxID=667725 RepID=A0A0L0G4L5_9EUKA|nr:hypothetical protein SARC_03756 [Sphaeroforma arctica JP610]KNC84022.1 hypothetical protein SARC_03756 [Sphaeroforma arctica JP610]|eukprot:XP_014157924.1 hypothetical protein SARC_03756 [Sphaeroforma arctica JP610]
MPTLSKVPPILSKEQKDFMTWFEALDDDQQKQVFSGLISSVSRKPEVISSIARGIAPFDKRDFMAALPKKLAMHILSYCDARSLCCSALVSKQWKSLADDDSLWHRMCSQHINKKCKRCGWGLPLEAETEMNFEDLENGEEVPIVQSNGCGNGDSNSHPADSKKRLFGGEMAGCFNNASTESDSERQTKRLKRDRSWKEVYAERMIVEKNWRKGQFRAAKLSAHTDSVLCLEFVRTRIVSAGLDKTIRVWDANTRECIKTMEVENTAKCLQFDKKKVIAGCVDGGIRILCLCTGACVRKIDAHRGQVNTLQFDDLNLVSGGSDSIVQVWSFVTGRCTQLKGHTDAVTCVRLHSGKVLSGSEDRTLKLWDLQTMICQTTFTGHKDTITCAQLSHNIVVSGSLDNTIKIWDTKTGECLNTLFSHTIGVNCLQFDSLRIVSGSEDGTIKVWDRQTGHCMYTLQGHDQSVNTLQFNDSMIVSGSDDNNIKIFDFSAEPLRISGF